MNSNAIELLAAYAEAGVNAPEALPTLTPFCLPFSEENGRKLRPAVIICPGGGYDYCSAREAAPVALRFAGYGVQAFVLQYTTGAKRFPTALLELAAAVGYVRGHADAYEIDPQRIAVCGFSAGAHLAASLAVHWNQPWMTEVLGDASVYQPNAQILCYPVITAGIHAHEGSIANLVGQQPTKASLARVSLEEQVSADTPPAFLWHTSDDNCVPIQNTLCYLSALAAQGIPFESHIYPHGAHGLSLADETTAAGEWHENPVCAPWFSACIAWIRRMYQ